MKTIAIIAEFNPFHNGHKYIIEKAKKETGADFCIVIMSCDFVQRGEPAIIDKFSRTRTALSCGADMVLELPIYYSLGSAEIFATGAVSILDRLGVVEELVFGSECNDIALLTDIAAILSNESNDFKASLSKHLKDGETFASARAKAILEVLPEGSDSNRVKEALSSPNNILAIEYIKALNKLGSSIKPVTIQREGEGYSSEELSEMASATAIRKLLLSGSKSDMDKEALKTMVPESSYNELISYEGKLGDPNDLSKLLFYVFFQESIVGFTDYIDINDDLSNRILDISGLHISFNKLCMGLKTKNMTYSRISRCLCYIILNMTKDHLEEYKKDGYTGYARILGMRKEISPVIKEIKNHDKIKIFNQLKEAPNVLTEQEMRLLDESLFASKLYNMIYKDHNVDEYRLQPIIL